MIELALLALTTQPRWIALTGTPNLFDQQGKVVDYRRVLFHELVQAGPNRFLLDGKVLVTCKDPNPFGKTKLVPSLSSPELESLRRKYSGKQVWFYGAWDAFAESKTFATSGICQRFGGESTKIMGIFQIGRVPIKFSTTIINYGAASFRGEYEVAEYKSGNPYLIQYAFRPKLVSGSIEKPNMTKDQIKQAMQPENYSIPYSVVIGPSVFDWKFSLKPPSPSSQRYLKRDILSYSSKIKGATKEQVGWFWGFPEGHSRQYWMKQDHWSSGDYWEATFKKGKCTDFFQSMPH